MFVISVLAGVKYLMAETATTFAFAFAFALSFLQQSVCVVWIINMARGWQDGRDGHPG